MTARTETRAKTAKAGRKFTRISALILCEDDPYITPLFPFSALFAANNCAVDKARYARFPTLLGIIGLETSCYQSLT